MIANFRVLQPTEFDFNFTQKDTQIKIIQRNGWLILTNSCRIKAINGVETLLIKERFGIDKWAILRDTITPEQVEELWFSSWHDPEFTVN